MSFALPLEGSCAHLPGSVSAKLFVFRCSMCVCEKPGFPQQCLQKLPGKGDTERCRDVFVFSPASIGEMPFTLSMCMFILKRVFYKDDWKCLEK